MLDMETTWEYKWISVYETIMYLDMLPYNLVFAIAAVMMFIKSVSIHIYLYA